MPRAPTGSLITANSTRLQLHSSWGARGPGLCPWGAPVAPGVPQAPRLRPGGCSPVCNAVHQVGPVWPPCRLWVLALGAGALLIVNELLAKLCERCLTWEQPCGIVTCRTNSPPTPWWPQWLRHLSFPLRFGGEVQWARCRDGVPMHPGPVPPRCALGAGLSPWGDTKDADVDQSCQDLCGTSWCHPWHSQPVSQGQRLHWG